jgi:hypothetical protein
MSLKKIHPLNVVDAIPHILILIWQIHFELYQLLLYVFLATMKENKTRFN